MMLPAVAVNVATVIPALKLTLDGMLIWLLLLLLLVRVTVVALAGAAERVSVHVADPGALIELGEQESEDGCTATVKLMVADWACPFSVALTVAFPAVLTVPVVAEKVALL